MTTLSVLLHQIDSGTVLLPEFQRGYVWNRDQVRGLMRSLYRGYPVGSLLVWDTSAGGTVRGPDAGAGVRQLLLDGQQRITSLYGVARGRPPAFFEGDASAFQGLRFNVADETFEFYAPAKMKGDVRWIDVTDLYVAGLEKQVKLLADHPSTAPDVVTYMTRLARLQSIMDRDFHAEKITGPDKTVDVVVDIFNRVNSGGTKLSKGDLALAKLCADWSEARAVMRKSLATWAAAGYDFSLDWLLRNITAVAAGRAQFSALDEVSGDEFKASLTQTTKYIGNFLDVVRGQLGLDHDRVLMGRYAIPVVSLYLHHHSGQFPHVSERNQMLYWYVNAALRGRFAGSTETILAQDYETLERGGIQGLITTLERWRGGNLRIGSHDFEASTLGSRFYPLLYLLTRVSGARDFGSGLVLSASMLGNLASLQVHHLFPKAQLYARGYKRDEVNAVANFCLLTQATNLKISNRLPEDYFAEAEANYPGSLASQWIPMDPVLWRIDRYRDFLAARRDLLTIAANRVLDGLRGGAPATTVELQRIEVRDPEDRDDDKATELVALTSFLRQAGVARPEHNAEISDPASGDVLAIAEAFWPDGLQPGRGNPAVLELDTDTDLSRLEALGYEVFTSVDALKTVVARRNEEASGAAQ